MRVAHIIKATQIGGAERHLLILLKALRERDVDAHLLLLVEADNLMDNLVTEAKDVDIPVQRVVINNHLDMPVINRLRSRLRQLKPDVVHTHLIHADFYGLLAGRLAFVPVILSTRHNDDNFRKNFFIKRFHRMLWFGNHGGIAISEAVRDFIIQTERVNPEKLFLVRYGIEHTSTSSDEPTKARQMLCDALGLDTNATIMGMACRLIEQKGIPYALQAMARLKRNPDLYLVIAGDGPLRKSIENEIEKLGITSQVHLLGWRDDVLKLMSGWDIFLMPSLWEGFGLVLLEAMSKRLPVIASNVSAIPEVVQHGETGLLVPPHNPDALAQAILMLAEDRALRAHMGLMAEDRLEKHFTVARMADETIAVYEKLLKK